MCLVAFVGYTVVGPSLDMLSLLVAWCAYLLLIAFLLLLLMLLLGLMLMLVLLLSNLANKVLLVGHLKASMIHLLTTYKRPRSSDSTVVTSLKVCCARINPCLVALDLTNTLFYHGPTIALLGLVLLLTIEEHFF